jgi:glucose/arabinose dehydrogenase
MKKKFFSLLIIILFLMACSFFSEVVTPTSMSNSELALPSTLLSSPTLVTQPVVISTPAPAANNAVAATAAVSQTITPPDGPIHLPPGFIIGVFARGLNAPRMMAVGPDGMLYVAERDAGRVIRLPDQNKDGQADQVEVVADGLNGPNSLAFYTDGSLYVAETMRVWRLSRPDSRGVFQDRQVIIDGLPNGGHSTRTLLFSPDGSTLYVSIGSSCNICLEQDKRRATIMRFNPDGSGGSIYAVGLRNAVGITFRPGTQELWATNNGRDYLGDKLPPETVYQVLEGKDYGWPRCHAGRFIDPDFGSPGSCKGIEIPKVEMAAHLAPLGLTFYNGAVFPASYQGNLFIALHGSWNSTIPVGYKVVRVPVKGGVMGKAEDFATGWLSTVNGGNTVWGRPVDVITGSDGSLFISDDSGGVIYRIFYKGQ